MPKKKASATPSATAVDRAVHCSPSHVGLHPVQNPGYAVYKHRRKGKNVRMFWNRDDDGKYWCGWTGRFTRDELIAMCRTTLEDLENDKL